MLILIVSPEIKNYEFYQRNVISCSLAIIQCSIDIDCWLLPVKARLSLFNLCRSFLASQTCWLSFRWENVTGCIDNIFVDTMEGFNMTRRNTAADFIKNNQYLLFQFFPSDFILVWNTGHFRALHCGSKVINLLDNGVSTFFVIDITDLSLAIGSDKSRTSPRTLLYFTQFALQG